MLVLFIVIGMLCILFTTSLGVRNSFLIITITLWMLTGLVLGTAPLFALVNCIITSEVAWVSYASNTLITFIEMLMLLSMMVVRYMVWYLKDFSIFRSFFCWLWLFVYGMMLIILGDRDLTILFIGWELIGLTSLMLISIHYTQLDSLKAGLKSLMMNRIGDVSFMSAMILVSASLRTTLITDVPSTNSFILGILILCAVWCKSAQYGMSSWLLAAMYGPTPVSALLHSATLVTAGMLLSLKTKCVWYHDDVKWIVCGYLLSLVWAGVMSLRSYDLKRMIACSTLANITLALLGAREHDGYRHLINHGWVKGITFMLIGILIHEAHNQDQRRAYVVSPLPGSMIVIAAWNLVGVDGSMVNESKETLLDFFNTSVAVWGVVILTTVGYCTIIAVVQYRAVWSLGAEALFIQYFAVVFFQWYSNDSLVVKWQVVSTVLVMSLLSVVWPSVRRSVLDCMDSSILVIQRLVVWVVRGAHAPTPLQRLVIVLVLLSSII